MLTMLLLAACTPDEPVADGTLAWLYDDVNVPADADIGGYVRLDHNASSHAEEPTFTAAVGFWEGDFTYAQPWSDPFDGLGDCGVWTEPPQWEGDATSLSAGTVFLDAGLGEPYAIPFTDDGYAGASFADDDWGPPAWGDVFAVTAVGDDLPSFDWDPAFALLGAALLITDPPQPDVGYEVPLEAGDLALAWGGADLNSVVTIEISASYEAGVYCEVPDTGAFTVAGELIAALDHLTGRRQLHVTRSRARYEPLGTGRYARLEASSGDQLSLVPE